MYNITKGQMKTCWIFGLLFIFFSLGAIDGGFPIIDLLIIFLIPFVLIFYYLGYKNYKKDNHE